MANVGGLVMDEAEFREAVRRLVNFAEMYVTSTFTGCKDFTEQSLEPLDRGLGEMHKILTEPADDQLALSRELEFKLPAVCAVVGVYVGETLRRTLGGEWIEYERDERGVEVLTLSLGDPEVAVVRPHGKVCKRIEDGSQDSILSYYEVLKGIRYSMASEGRAS